MEVKKNAPSEVAEIPAARPQVVIRAPDGINVSWQPAYVAEQDTGPVVGTEMTNAAIAAPGQRIGQVPCQREAHDVDRSHMLRQAQVTGEQRAGTAGQVVDRLEVIAAHPEEEPNPASAQLVGKEPVDQRRAVHEPAQVDPANDVAKDFRRVGTRQSKLHLGPTRAE